MQPILRFRRAAALALSMAIVLDAVAAQEDPAPVGAALGLADTTLGTPTDPAPAQLGLGHAVSFEVSGATAVDVAYLLASLGGPAAPFELSGVPVVIDPSAFLVLGAHPVGAAGQVSFELKVPPGLPGGAAVHVQVFLLDFDSFEARATNGLELTTVSEPFKIFAAGSYSYHTLAWAGGAVTITNEEDWYALWMDHVNPWTLPAPPPPVDFRAHAVLCTFPGFQPNTAYGFGLDEVVFTGNALAARGTVFEPGPSCIGAEMLIYPYEFVLIDAAVAAPAYLETALGQGSPCE